MKKILFFAIWIASLAAYALPTYEPFTEFAPTLAAHATNLVVTTTNGTPLGTNANATLTNCLDLATGGYTAPTGELWGDLAYSGIANAGAPAVRGLDIAVVSNITLFTQTKLSALLPSTFPGMPAAGQAITNFVENIAQPLLWASTNFQPSNYCGNSAVLVLSSDVTRPTNGTKTLYFSYLLNVAQQGQLGAGNNGRYLALLSQTNLNLPSAVYTNWNSFFNVFNGTASGGVRYASHGLIQDVAQSIYYIGPCDSSTGKNWSSTTLTNSYGNDVFVVGSYVFNASGSDTNVMWLNPATNTFGGAAPPASSIFPLKMAFNMSDIAGIAFIDRVGNGASGGVGTNYVANLLVGTTWSYVTGGPEFTNQPVGVNAVAGQNVTLTSGAVAAGQTVSFQWYKISSGTTNVVNNGAGGAGGSATVSGATTSTLSLNGVQPGDVGNYFVLATASGTGYTLPSSVVSMVVDPYFLIQPPQNVAGNYGTQVAISATASTTQSTLSYQWYEVENGVTNALSNGTQSDGSSVSGASGTVSGGTKTITLNVSNISYQNNGFAYYLFVTNNVNNSTTSAESTLTVYDPGIITQPVSEVVNANGTAAFSVNAVGSPTLSYQWYVTNTMTGQVTALSDGSTPWGSSATISGSQSNILTIQGVTDADATNGSYFVTVQNGVGTTTNSAVVTLIVADPVAVLSPPASRTERAGDHTAFVVGATGNALSYQWSYNASPIAGATTSALLLTNIQTGSAGTYSVLVSNINDSASASATLNVVNNPFLALGSTNIIVARIGDGIQPYATNGNTIYLDQYTTSGTYVSTIQVPDENTGQAYGTGSASTVIGSPALLAQGGVGTDAANSLFLSLSAANQQYLTFAGYCEQYPFAGPDVSVGGAAYLRGLASVNAFGIYSLTYTNQGLYNGGNHTIREGFTLDGINWWTTGQAGANGVKFVNTTVGSYATGNGIPVITSGAATPRSIQIVGGNLVFSDYGGAGGSGLYACAGIPEPTANGTVPSSIILNEGGIPNDFAFSPDGQTIYIADSQTYNGGQGGGIQRWDTNAGSGWSYSYTLQPLSGGTNGALGMTVYFPTNITAWGSGITGAVIYATTYGDETNSLVQIVDNGSGSTSTVITTAGPNQALRGVRFGPAAIPVSITTQPQNQTNFPNNNVTFTVSATGSQPIYYQWQYNGTNIAGATKTSFTTNNISFASAGNYTVVVSNLIPTSVTSSNAVLTVTAGAPTIAAGVPSFSESAGDHLALAPTVNGSMPITTYWYQVVGASSNLVYSGPNIYLVLTNIQTSQSGTYYMLASNIYGTAHSSGTLSVTPRPTPFSTNNLVVARIGDGAQALSGVTGNTLYLDQYTTGGTYVSSVQVPDEGYGQPYGTGSTLSVGTTPGLLFAGANGPNVDANVGALLTLSSDNQTLDFVGYCLAYPFAGPDVTIDGTNAGSYWRGIGAVNGTATYSLVYTNSGLCSLGNHVVHSAATADQTNYWVAGEAGSAGVKYMNSGPAGASYLGGNGLPGVGGSGPGPRQVRLINGNIYFTDVAATPAGLYEFGGEPTGPSTPSLVITESNNPVDFAISPDGATIYIADIGTFGGTNVQAGGIQRFDNNGGSFVYSYTLPVGGAAAGARGMTVNFNAQSAWGPGITGAVLYATTSEASGNRLIKIVDNGPASAVTTLATANPSSTLSGVRFGPAILPVSIVSQPQNQIAVTGTGAEFSVGAAGTTPLFYQWQWNGTNIPGATASTLVVSGAQAAQGGNYGVIVSNLAPSSLASSTASISFTPYLTFNNNFTSWSANEVGGSGLPIFDANGETNVVELTQGVGNQASSTFYQSPVYVGGFLASWTYQVLNPSGTLANGIAFVVQNDPRGPAAIGDSAGNAGASLGYGNPGGITNSVALELNIYPSATGGVGISLNTNGALGPYISTGSVNLASGDPISVTVQYINGLATVTLDDPVTTNSFSTSATVNVPAVVGGSEAYVGFTGADGGSVSTQIVSNFVFQSLIQLTAINPGNNTLVLTWPSAGVGAYVLQKSPTLLPPAWANVTNTVTTVNGTNQVVVPITGSSMFYQLVNP